MAFKITYENDVLTFIGDGVSILIDGKSGNPNSNDYSITSTFSSPLKHKSRAITDHVIKVLWECERLADTMQYEDINDI